MVSALPPMVFFGLYSLNICMSAIDAFGLFVVVSEQRIFFSCAFSLPRPLRNGAGHISVGPAHCDAPS